MSADKTSPLNISQMEAIEHLREKCPELSASHFNMWIRAGELIEGTDFVNVQRGRRTFHFYDPLSLPKIRRLYHYSVVRGLTTRVYRPLVALQEESLTLFAIFLESSHYSLPTNPEVFPDHKLFQKVAEDSDGIFQVKLSFAVYGGNIKGIALCICLDEVELHRYIDRIEAELRTNKTRVLLHWRKMDTYSLIAYTEKDAMKAIIVVTVSGQDLTEVYEKFKTVAGVIGSCLVHGDAQIILVIEAKNEAEFTEIVMGKIRTQGGVSDMRTYICIHGYDDLNLGFIE